MALRTFAWRMSPVSDGLALFFTHAWPLRFRRQDPCGHISGLDDSGRRELNMLRFFDFHIALRPDAGESTRTNSPAHSPSLRGTVGNRCQETASGLTACRNFVSRWRSTCQSVRTPHTLETHKHTNTHAYKVLHLWPLGTWM